MNAERYEFPRGALERESLGKRKNLFSKEKNDEY